MPLLSKRPPLRSWRNSDVVCIGAGGFQSIGMIWSLLFPTNGWIALTFFSHKILRWACPFLLIGMLVSSAWLSDAPLYRGLLLGQFAFYALSALGNWIPSQSRLVRYLRLPTMFTAMNLALLLGFFRWLRGRQTGVWTRTDRSTPVERANVEPESSFSPLGAK